MDKKGIIAITLSILTLVFWQYFYARKHPLPAKPPTELAAPTAAPAPAPTAAPAFAEPAAEAPSQTVEAPVAEETATLTTGVARYVFTNRGGLKTAVLTKHKGLNDQPVTLNAWSDVPVGAVSSDPDKWPSIGYSMREDAAGRRVVLEQAGDAPLRTTKTFEVRGGEGDDAEYVIDLTIDFENTGATPLTSKGLYVHLGTAAAGHPKDLPTYTSFDWYREGKLHDTAVTWFEPSKIPLVGIQLREGREDYAESVDGVQWAAVKNQYFTTLATVVEGKVASVWAKRIPVEVEGVKVFAIDGAIGLEEFTVEPGARHTVKFTLYTGPKEYKRLTKFEQGQAEIMQFGFFKPVSIFLLKMMNWLKSWLGAYAAAIFVMTLLIKTALWPLQNISTRSMKKMQALQPKMTELREKYKDDPTRMNQEVMKLYKDYGINPFGGCLPMFVQIPIFFGFYRMLGVAPELRNSSFLWINDLSQPDTVFHLGGFPVNVLPLIMAVTMVWQMRLTPKSGDAVQQRIFMFVPLIFVVFCYNFASALALYWTVQNLFSIVQLYVTRNQELPALTRVSGGSSGSSGPTQKKKKRR